MTICSLRSVSIIIIKRPLATDPASISCVQNRILRIVVNSPPSRVCKTCLTKISLSSGGMRKSPTGNGKASICDLNAVPPLPLSLPLPLPPLLHPIPFGEGYLGKSSSEGVVITSIAEIKLSIPTITTMRSVTLVPAQTEHDSIASARFCKPRWHVRMASIVPAGAVLAAAQRVILTRTSS